VEREHCDYFTLVKRSAWVEEERSQFRANTKHWRELGQGSLHPQQISTNA